MTLKTAPRFAAAALLVLTLSGCISLLPKQKPSQLYRFDGTAAVAAAEAAGGPKTGVIRAGGVFQRESAGDRILTVTGDKTAYIAQARWVAPAEVLFEESLARAFDAPGKTRLVGRGEPAKADYALRIDVRDFETRYAGRGPTVLVRVRATLLHDSGHAVQEKMFEASVPADDNRIHAIVGAYDKAVGEVLGELKAWVDAGVG